MEDPEGIYNEFRCYYFGWGVDANENIAIDFLKAAASLGWTPAQSRLGEFYLDGYVLPKDYNKALEYFREAEENGNLLAIFNI